MSSIFINPQKSISPGGHWLDKNGYQIVFPYEEINDYPLLDDDEYIYTEELSPVTVMFGPPDYVDAPWWLIPPGSTNIVVKLHIRGKCAVTDNYVLGVFLQAGLYSGQNYYQWDSWGSTFEDKTFTWVDNPITTSAWTSAQINSYYGSIQDSNYILRFGISHVCSNPWPDHIGRSTISRLYMEIGFDKPNQLPYSLMI